MTSPTLPWIPYPHLSNFSQNFTFMLQWYNASKSRFPKTVTRREKETININRNKQVRESYMQASHDVALHVNGEAGCWAAIASAAPIGTDLERCGGEVSLLREERWGLESMAMAGGANPAIRLLSCQHCCALHFRPSRDWYTERGREREYDLA